jgi:hypothetical protein
VKLRSRGRTQTELPSETGGWRRWWPWLALVGGLELCFIRVTILSARFVYGEGHAERPIVAFVAVMLLGSALYCGAALLLRRRAPPPLWFALLSAVIFRVTLLGGEPIQEDDFYRYLWDGKVILAGIDPYRYSPAELEDFALGAGSPRDAEEARALNALLEVRRAAAANEVIFARINHPEHRTVYPLVSQAVFALVAAIPGEGWSVRAHVLALRSVVCLFDLGCMVVLALLLRRCGRAPAECLLYGWCPVVVKEFAGTGHVDAVAVCLLLISLLGAVQRSWWLAATGAAAAVLAKLYAVILLLLVFAFLRREPAGRGAGRRRSGAFLALTLVLCAAGFVAYPESAALRVAAWREFLSTWEVHDALFLWLRSALALLVPAVPGAEAAAARVVSGVLLLGIMLRHSVAEGAATYEHEPPAAIQAERFLGRAFAILAACFVVSPIGLPWYFSWAIALVPFARNWSWLALAGLLPLYYLRFAFYYSASADTLSERLALYDTVVVSLEFGAFFVLWLVVAWRNRRSA